MPEKKITYTREQLDIAIKDSFLKMIELKEKLGQSVVTNDSCGIPVIISAKEAKTVAGEYIDIEQS